MEKRYGYINGKLSDADKIVKEIDEYMQNFGNDDNPYNSRKPQFWLRMGPGRCATFVQHFTDAPKDTRLWRKGSKVFGNTNLQPGTAIATFDDTGRYPGMPTNNHAAIYLGQDTSGIYVYQQCSGRKADLTKSWNDHKYKVSKIKTGALPAPGKFLYGPEKPPAEIGILDARRYFVVTDMYSVENTIAREMNEVSARPKPHFLHMMKNYYK